MSQSFMTRRVIVNVLAIALLLNCSYWYLLPTVTRLQVTLQSACNSTVGEASTPIIKVSMAYGNPHPMYQKALENHERHAKRWGHSMKVLRTDFVGGLWNKPAYLLSLVLEELKKPASERARWLMFVSPPKLPIWLYTCLLSYNRWVDADTIILNPAIPPDTFLPPDDMPDIHMVSSKDLVGLNAGVLFFHVHRWAVDYLTETLAFSYHLPEDDARFENWPEQEAMTRLLQRPSNGSEGQAYREGHLYLPREWINSYYNYDMERRKKGDWLLHFPGMKDERWPAMGEMLNTTDLAPNEWEVPLQDTDYPAKLAQYWDRVRTVRAAVKSAEQAIKHAPAGTPISARAAAVSRLYITLQEHADETELLQQRLDELRTAVSEEA
jgi:hypothetical protein